MVRFLMYVFGEFKQQKLTLGMLAEIAGFHVNSRSAADCMTPDPVPTPFILEDTDEKPQILSVVNRNRQPRSPPGRHSCSSRCRR